MKKTAQTIGYAALALLLAAIPAALVAQPHGGFGSRGFGEGRMLERIADRLELSDEQREQVRAVHEVYRPDAEALADVMRAAREDLQEKIWSDSFDEVAIREAAGRVAAVSADLAVLRARVHGDVRQILTPEQIEKAELMREMIGDFAEARRGRRGGGPGRGAPDFD
jgi:Spy/CpxP family protein refolding chaperone